jgi:glycerophosphoryl diester phosphodiesterase
MITICMLLSGVLLNANPAAQMPDSRIIIAHRGACGYLPEHTLAAKAMAYAMGADYLEQDIVLTRDDIPIIVHDVQIDTVTDVARQFPERKRADGRYYAIDFTLAELKQLKVTERMDLRTGQPAFTNRFPAWQSSFQISTLEEEFQLVQGLNKSTGRKVGVYPEIKAPAWHRKQGHDPSRIVLEVLGRYGYRTKADLVYVQCFEFAEVKRIRTELGYQGKLIQLLGEKRGTDGTDYDYLQTKAGLEDLAKVADGIGPALQQVVTGKGKSTLKISDLVQRAHALKLEVHPYTCRADALPAYAASLEELLSVFFLQAGVDGVFCDHPDRGAAFLRSERQHSKP